MGWTAKNRASGTRTMKSKGNLILHQRKSIDFSGVTVTAVQTFVFKENNERFTEKREVEEST